MELGQARVGALARQLAHGGDDVRAVHRHLGAVGDVEWEGLGAARFRARLADTDRRVGTVAHACDEAADRLRAHALALAAVVGP